MSALALGRQMIEGWNDGRLEGRVIMVEFFIDDEALRAELGIGPRPRRPTSSATPG